MKTARFPKGVPMTVDEVAAVVGEEFKEMHENPPDAVLAVREEMMGKSGRQRMTWARVAAEGGLYGYPKGVQQCAEVATRKLARAALKAAKRIFAKDAEVVPFLQAHVKREHSKSARVLLSAMRELGPKLASEGHGKEAGATEYGLYGFKARTVDLGLDACKEVRVAAGRITADLHRRKADLHDKLTGFWKEHSKQGKCAYAGMLMSCYPDASTKVATQASLRCAIFPATRRFVPTRQFTGGVLREVEILPTDLTAFRRTILAKIRQAGLDEGQVRTRVASFADVFVASALNEDGVTRDVDGIARVRATCGTRVVAETDVLFTGTHAPGPEMTMLASGDVIEWLP